MKTKVKLIIARIVVLLAVLTVLSPIATATFKANTEEQTIRVNFPLQKGFAEVNENGEFSGYTYEYLMKTAQLTGWNYDFVAGESSNEALQAGLELLQRGELDISGATTYNDALAEIYDYTAVPYGESNFVLLAASDNRLVNERTIFSLPELRVALIETAKTQNGEFEKYAQEKGLVYEAVYAEDNDACEELLASGKADVLIGKDVNIAKGLKTVLAFASQPFYFITTKGNGELARALSQSIQEINSADPLYALTLHAKYFNSGIDEKLALTESELDFVENAPPIRAVVIADREPVENYDPNTNLYSGIAVDILRKMSTDSGLSISFVSVPSMAEAQKMLADGSADLIASLPADYAVAKQYDVLITSPICTMPVVRISNVAGQGQNKETLVYSYIRSFRDSKDVKFVDSLAEIVELVNSGEYASAYVNGYIVQHYLESKHMPNIVLTQTPYSNYELCVGVRRGADLRLMRILEQCVAKLKSSDIEDIVYRNIMHSTSLSWSEMILRNPLPFFLPFFGGTVLVIALLLLLFFRTRKMSRLIASERSKYKKISTIDQLAQVYNNETFKRLTTQYLSDASATPQGALFICDIDGFKGINDTYGHLVGDEVIKGLGNLLSEMFRSSDLVGRLGGDEFVMLMKNISDRELVAKRCEELLTRCRTVSSRCEITLSIGIVMFEGTMEFEPLLEEADKTLYSVKNNGKNSFEIR